MFSVRREVVAEGTTAVAGRPREATRSWQRPVTAGVALALLLGNAAGIVWLWYDGGNLTGVDDAAELVTSLARLTGLLGAYLALIQVLLLARLPWLDRLIGFDHLTVVHRWNGNACIALVVAHTVLSVWGYALLDDVSLWAEVETLLGAGVYPGMITATVGTALLVAVGLTSVVIARRRLPYEWWYAIHLAAYAGIALAWFHQIPTGNELALDDVAANYWRALYLVTLGAIVVFRLGVPVVNALRFRLRVAEVVPEGPDVVSVRVTGHRLDGLGARPGQFFLWRFLSHGRWWESHPFSLSEAPNGNSLRMTAKGVGDYTRRLRDLRPGTHVFVEGPFGVFTTEARRCTKTLLIAGGIGITPIRALLDELDGDTIVLYRVIEEDEVLFTDELERVRAHVEVVAGDHEDEHGHDLLSAEHLRELVPDIAERDVFISGPPGMVSFIERNVRRTGVPRRQIHSERFAL
jgi:predicted ferric reductase